jgi:hypothetical protein
VVVKNNGAGLGAEIWVVLASLFSAFGGGCAKREEEESGSHVALQLLLDRTIAARLSASWCLQFHIFKLKVRANPSGRAGDLQIQRLVFVGATGLAKIQFKLIFPFRRPGSS